MNRWRTLLIVTCALAVGCTKPGEREQAASRWRAEPQPTVGEAAERDERPIILAFGDSLSEGFGAGAGESYPDYLQRELDAAGYRYRVVNLGVSGDTSTGGLNRVGPALELKPEIVIVELGGNDGLRGMPIEATRANLAQIIEAFQRSGAKVVLAGMTLPPNYGRDYIRSFERMYRELAAQYRVRLIPFLMQDIVRQLRERPELMQKDGIHPTREGNAIMAKTVFGYLKPLLRRE
jgi:acyl-CoA thioesterase-1